MIPQLKLLLFILFSLPLTANSQDFESIKRNIGLIQKGGTFKPDSAGLFKLKKPKIQYCLSDDIIDGANFHLADLNLDGRKDLIYSGICDPYDRTVIFINSEKGFETIFDEPGKVVSIEKKENETSIFVLFSPCCCLTDYGLKEIKVSRKNKTLIRGIDVSGFTKISFGDLKEINVKGIVRKSPSIDDTPKKEKCSDRILIGNHFDELKTSTRVIELNKVDEWSLILYEKEPNKSFIGWIKETK